MKSIQENIRRIDAKQSGILINRDTRAEKKALRQSKYRRIERLSTIKKNITNNEILCKQRNNSIPLSVPSSKDRVLSYELNLRAILVGYMIGTGGFDISRVMTMIGIEGGSSFERQFYRSGSYVHEVVMGVCKDVVDEALREEMVVTTEEKLKDQLDSAAIENLKDNIKKTMTYMQLTMRSLR